jgi:hypothetical protein
MDRINEIDDIDALVERYVSMWNEPDPGARRALLHELWADGAVQVLADPPVEVREAAANLRFEVPPFEVHGLAALEERVTRAYEMFVAPGQYVFRARPGAVRLIDGLVAYAWDMVDRADGSVAGTGCDVMALDADGRIRVNYQFIQG